MRNKTDSNAGAIVMTGAPDVHCLMRYSDYIAYISVFYRLTGFDIHCFISESFVYGHCCALFFKEKLLRPCAEVRCA